MSMFCNAVPDIHLLKRQSLLQRTALDECQTPKLLVPKIYALLYIVASGVILQLSSKQNDTYDLR